MSNCATRVLGLNRRSESNEINSVEAPVYAPDEHSLRRSSVGCSVSLDRDLCDPAHTSGIEHDIGRWHSPISPLLAAGMPDIDFAIVDVKQLDKDAYSVLTSAVDWGALKPVQ